MSEEPKWTPGPYHVVEERGRRTAIYINGPNGYGSIATLYYRMNWQHDARLLAAAPDMVAALEANIDSMAAVAERLSHGSVERNTLEDAIAESRAALAKAEGREQS